LTDQPVPLNPIERAIIDKGWEMGWVKTADSGAT